jgi:hypothetical protein
LILAETMREHPRAGGLAIIGDIPAIRTIQVRDDILFRLTATDKAQQTSNAPRKTWAER